MLFSGIRPARAAEKLDLAVNTVVSTREQTRFEPGGSFCSSPACNAPFGPGCDGLRTEPAERESPPDQTRFNQLDPPMISDGARAGSVESGVTPDDLSRDVYCVLGIPVDAIDIPGVLRRIETAAASKAPFLISTPNLNFLVSGRSDPDFRESLLLSDLCPADGVSIVWIARLIGIPIRQRSAGSDFFDAFKAEHRSAKPLKVFLFGGAEGVASAACRALNAQPGGLRCVGTLYPGFGSVDEMSGAELIDNVNSSDADFLVASLGAKKGQAWLLLNHSRLLMPVRAHLGASLNFLAGTVKRAPPIVRKFGLEWLWRIKEEPSLWRRYWNDGSVLLRLLVTGVLPLAISSWWLRLRCQREGHELVVKQAQSDVSVTVGLSGPAIAPNVDKIIRGFREALRTKKRIMIDFSDTRAIDARFLGLLLMLRKELKGTGTSPILIGMSARLERMFRLHGLGFLLSPEAGK
jgi:N-acetylglucosaminyldiphosphoundecaprenol N-acetyl-beta-D-mannosaminyltransferase